MSGLAILGLILGVILAVGLAYSTMVLWVWASNDVGTEEGTYKDFTGESMKIL